MSRLGKALVVTAFTTWLFLPLVLIGLGVKSDFAALEKRPAAQLPRLAISAFGDPRLTSSLAAYLGDRVPLRVEALALKAWLDLEVFGDSPNPSVLLGAEGWLFHRQSVVGPRRPAAARQAVVTVRKISRILQASGRRLVFVVAPNKDAIYPEVLGPAEPLAKASRESRQRVRGLFRWAELPGYIDLWQALERLKEQSNEKIYWPHDTHWTSESVLEASRLIVDLLDPTLWDGGAITTRPDLHRGDLAGKIGRPTWDHGTHYSVQRGLRVEQVIEQAGLARRLSSTGNAARFEPRVLMVYDSFGAGLLGILSQYLKEGTWIDWNGMSKERLTSIADEFVRAEVIVLETVERAFIARFSRRARGFPPHLVGRLLDDLPVIDLELPPQEAATRLSPIEIELPAAAVDVDRYLVVQFVPSIDEAVIHQIRIETKTVDGTWRRLPRWVLPAQLEERRVVAELPAATTVVRIRPPALDVRSVGLVDLAGED